MIYGLGCLFFLSGCDCGKRKSFGEQSLVILFWWVPVPGNSRTPFITWAHKRIIERDAEIGNVYLKCSQWARTMRGNKTTQQAVSRHGVALQLSATGDCVWSPSVCLCHHEFFLLMSCLWGPPVALWITPALYSQHASYSQKKIPAHRLDMSTSKLLFSISFPPRGREAADTHQAHNLVPSFYASAF